MLTDQKIKQIVEATARENHVDVTRVVTAPAIDSAGDDAIDVTIIITPGSFAAIMGERSARTVSDVIRKLESEGETRFPITSFDEEKG